MEHRGADGVGRTIVTSRPGCPAPYGPAGNPLLATENKDAAVLLDRGIAHGVGCDRSAFRGAESFQGWELSSSLMSLMPLSGTSTFKPEVAMLAYLLGRTFL